MRTPLVAALLAVATLALSTTPVAAEPANDSLTWSVTPSGPQGPNGRTALDYKLDPGATITDHLAVTNHSRRPLTLRLYASDAFTTAGGGFDLLAAGAAPRDAGGWVTLARTTVTLPKSSRVVIPLTLTVPGNATPGDHAAGVVASLTDAGTGTGPDGRRVTVDHRVGTRIYLRVTGPLRPALTVTDVQLTSGSSWNPVTLPHLTATFTINNIGNVRLSAQPSVHAHGPFGLGERSANGAAVPEVLPGGSLRTSIRLDGVPPLLREQLAVSVLPAAAGGRAIDPAPARAESQHTVWLIPWSQLGLLALVTAIVVGRLLARRRRRRALREAVAAAEQRGREQAISAEEGPS
ncbi:hypothetical protein Acy02nite_50260 [Actinoplanes cyaneus]|uniref:DUF916 domain-containing protein n=1 Tax=Actinoplanes cyaneus TaxID=52696 RepID=A0A919M2D7_9ACTN|nr:DUF916 domain-containing protein [Actinoplanes cyaneus]MCW2141083.1 protein of unknown function (DUF916) [Actinoplanes cyaneus]GID67145.1 hypothetical protein Acy02nite_50260 [Actinoplanes cyaneus]